jgi:hypothetical protein
MNATAAMGDAAASTASRARASCRRTPQVPDDPGADVGFDSTGRVLLRDTGQHVKGDQMSTAPSATHSTPAAARVTAERHSGTRSASLTRDFRARLVASGLALSSLTTATALLWSPGPDRDDHTYASFEAVRDAAWAGMLLDVAGIVVAGITVGLAVCMLVRARGARLAALGAAGTAVGGALFAAGIYAYFNLGWYATEPNAIPASAGSALMSYVADNPVHLAALQAPGLFLLSLGALLLAAALWRSSAAARWVPSALVIVVMAQFLMPWATLDFVQAAMAIPFLGIAWRLWKTTPA